jgi:hypothetical protein
MTELKDFMNRRSIENEKSDAAREIHRLKSRVRELSGINRSLMNLLEDAEHQVEVALELTENASEPLPIKARLSKKKNEAVMVAMATDWHVEERVDPATINGLNEYNLEIAQFRAHNFFRNLLWRLRYCQGNGRNSIEKMILWIGGDIITGYIHEELQESNYLSPTEATLFAQDLFWSGIDLILKESGLKEIIVLCSYGNHGRTTIRRKHSTAAKNSFEWLMFHSMAQRYKGNKRIKFHIADGSHLYLDVFDKTIRFHHGDDVKYYGGVGGLSIPMRKAHDSWNASRHADITVVGHWHQLVNLEYAIVNGSLIGYNAFAQSIKARYEPPQQGVFLLEPDIPGASSFYKLSVS